MSSNLTALTNQYDRTESPVSQRHTPYWIGNLTRLTVKGGEIRMGPDEVAYGIAPALRKPPAQVIALPPKKKVKTPG